MVRRTSSSGKSYKYNNLSATVLPTTARVKKMTQAFPELAQKNSVIET